MKQLIVLVVCSLLVCSTGVLATEAPVAHWSFDNAVDPGHDDAGLGHTGTVNGAMVTTGRFGNALSFNGTSDYVDTGQSFQSTFQSDFSISFWMRPVHGTANISGYGEFIMGIDLGPSEYGDILQFRRAKDVGTIFAYTSAGWPGVAPVYSPSFVDNSWHHIAVTLHQEGTSCTAILYIDGITKVTDYEINTLMSGFNAGGETLFLGQTSYGNAPFDNSYFNGALDEVRIFDRAITSDEVASLYLYNVTPEPATLLLLGLGGLVFRLYSGRVLIKKR
jgi:hypothetical protein